MLYSLMLTAALTCADMPSVDMKLTDMDISAVAALASGKPECPAAKLTLGRMEMATDKLDPAIIHLEAGAKGMLANSDIEILLGNAYMARAQRDSSLGDAKTGKAHFEDAVRLDPENLDARAALTQYLRGAPWIAGGDMDEADKHATFIESRDPHRGLMERVANRLQDKDEDAAVDMLVKGIQQHPDWTDAVLQLVNIYQASGDFSNAWNLLESHISKEKPDPMMTYQLGRTAAISGEWLDEGRTAMQQYIDMRKADDTLAIPLSPALWRLGMIDEQRGDKAAARADYQQALELDPENENAKSALDSLE